MAAVMSLTLAGQPAGRQLAQQQATTQLPNAPQQQQIPDAPKLQLPGVGPVTPGKGTTPTDNGSGSSSGTPSADIDQDQVPASLPPTQLAPPPDVDAAPFIPEKGKYADVYQLPALRVNYVEIPFTVKDNKGHLVPGIQPREIHVYENGVRQKMQVFTVDPFPLTVAVVIDQSLPVDVMTRVNNALGALPQAFAASDDVAVFTYNNGPKMQTDFTAGTSARLSYVISNSKSVGRESYYYAPGEGLGGGININSGQQEHINPLTTGHGVSSPQGVAQVEREAHTLNDAILAAAKATTKAANGRRRIVYVISDGKEYGSTAKYKEVLKYLQTNKVQVYGTLVGDSSVEGLGFIGHLHLPLTVRDNILRAYTSQTGGECYADYRTKGIEQSFARITEEERTQYTVGYNTRESFLDEKYRKVEVRVLRPNLEVIAKDGYYPSAMDVRPSTPRPPARPAAQPSASAPSPAPPDPDKP